MLNYKEYIYAIYQEHSFSKAAQKLFVSQPWLSSVVKKVEQEIKTPLFDRSTNPISLTPAGEYYIQQVEKVMAIEEDMREHFAALSGPDTQLHIGSSMFFCTYVLPRLFQEFREQNPQITLTLTEGSSAALSEKLLYDEKTGRPLNNNLLDYKLSTFLDHPDLRASFIENYEPTSAYGTKALGEPPACSPAPAIRNAVLQAVGVAVNEIPMRPHILFEEFKKAVLI